MSHFKEIPRIVIAIEDGPEGHKNQARSKLNEGASRISAVLLFSSENFLFILKTNTHPAHTPKQISQAYNFPPSPPYRETGLGYRLEYHPSTEEYRPITYTEEGLPNTQLPPLDLARTCRQAT
ncbi:uncharacterized protein PGTG_14661 [Puccinia graminis f. sp. tritici CRL 75-36-700-3]|uniref:Uncharacterized protein n=1 Tax=Puccinia graminis f. sp. tritici (strain CRL 75-36-700-3 / race SCCL) TaxID=418459 RepID=E3KWM8_PUCGT|nr:uncharacterized protein PGTG_14661 [Puccinia graminis f. sp. tritici CRL 75-36-700-3]EFP88695.1 hypothetical protein PGTG_14661 [Puccinia graminis f. sp. tritici CRL 75-36-700-3]